jgi:dTDP-4-dehydrorhamnose 3,5-epimerase
MVKSNANVLRGFHVHVKHADYLTVVSGEMLLGLHDFRPESSTYKQSCFMLIDEVDPFLVTIPVGIGHGFYFKKPAIHFYGVSEYFDGSDEYGCTWNDKNLNLDWPCSEPHLSSRDQGAGSYSELANFLSKVGK